MQPILNLWGRTENMPKIKSAKLTIHSHIDNFDSAPEVNDTEYSALIKTTDSEIGIAYEETGEGGKLFCDILVRGERVTVARRGAICSTLVFEEGKEYGSIYEIPPYKFDMAVKTKRLKIDLLPTGGTIDILYEMNVGGAVKKSRMKITVSEVDQA